MRFLSQNCYLLYTLYIRILERGKKFIRFPTYLELTGGEEGVEAVFYPNWFNRIIQLPFQHSLYVQYKTVPLPIWHARFFFLLFRDHNSLEHPLRDRILFLKFFLLPLRRGGVTKEIFTFFRVTFSCPCRKKEREREGRRHMSGTVSPFLRVWTPRSSVPTGMAS